MRKQMFLFYYEREARQMRKFKLFLAILASVVLLTACTGGGNSKSDGKENTGGNAGNSAQTETTAKEVEVTELIKVTVPEGLKATEFQGFWAVMKEGEPWRASIIDYEFDRYPIIDEPKNWDSLVKRTKEIYDVKPFTLNGKEGIVYNQSDNGQAIIIVAPIDDKNLITVNIIADINDEKANTPEAREKMLDNELVKKFLENIKLNLLLRKKKF